MAESASQLSFYPSNAEREASLFCALTKDPKAFQA